MIIKTGFKNSEVGVIPKDWKINIVNEITKRVVVGFVGVCSRFYCDRKNGIPMIRTTNLTRNGIDYDDLKYVTNDFHKKNVKSQLHRNDILIARFGKSGLACLFEKDFEANCLNVVVITPDETKCIPKFLLYCFNSKITEHQTSASLVGTIMDILNTKTIAKFFIPLPTIEEQKSIVKVLSDLDSKIELNQNKNKTFEEISKVIFKQWFVDFNFPNKEGKPYKASNGEMIYNEELGHIPKGWHIETLDDVCSLITDGSHTSPKENNSGSQRIATVKNMREYDIDLKSCKKISQEDYDELVRSGCKPEKNDVLLSKDGTIGNILLHNGEDVVLLSSIAILRSNEKISSYYLKTYFTQKNIKMLLKEEYSSGSVIPRIVLKDLKKLPIVVPNSDIIKKFDQVIAPILENILINIYATETLIEIRNSLLPQLLFGKIRVPLGVNS